MHEEFKHEMIIPIIRLSHLHSIDMAIYRYTSLQEVVAPKYSSTELRLWTIIVHQYQARSDGSGTSLNFPNDIFVRHHQSIFHTPSGTISQCLVKTGLCSQALWNVYLYSSNIDRVVWSGVIGKQNIMFKDESRFSLGDSDHQIHVSRYQGWLGHP